MVFMCQKDSFLTEFDTQIVTCEKVDDASELTNAGIDVGKEATINIFRVVLDDTILFPEGGGQPDDRGTIGSKDENHENVVNVIRSIRKGTQAIHYVQVPGSGQTTSPYNTGDNVTAKIDWKRRFDHMQQHSDAKDISSEQIARIEDEVNSKIRQALPVTVDVVELDDPKLKHARGRNLPEDVKGQIRIVTMAGVESNVCCGTHVTNLSQLQLIKLLQVVKKKGKCLLHFLSGNRVLDRFSQQFQREQLLMGILNSSPSEIPTAAERLNIVLKTTRKSCQVLSKDLAVLEAKKLTGMDVMPKFWAYHRDNVDLDFANALLREIGAPKNTVLLITIKTEGSTGFMMLVGGGLEKDKLANLGDALCEILDGKGNVRGTQYQAKVNKINNVKKAVTLAKDIVDKIDCEKN